MTSSFSNSRGGYNFCHCYCTNPFWRMCIRFSTHVWIWLLVILSHHPICVFVPRKQKDVFEDVYFTTSPWTRLQLRDRVSDVRTSALTAADFRRSRLNYTFLVVHLVTLFQHCAWCMKCCVIVDLWVDLFMCLIGRLFVCVWGLTCATTSGAHAVLPVSCRLRLVWVVWIEHFRECF